MSYVEIARIEAEFEKLRFKPKQKRAKIEEEKKLPQSESIVLPTTPQF